MKNGFWTLFIIGFILLIINPLESKAQGEQQVIVFSGLLVEGDSAYGIPNAHIYIPKVGRGRFQIHGVHFGCLFWQVIRSKSV